MSSLESLQSLMIPDLWQQKAVHSLREGKDVVVHAPTGSGKTLIFESLYPTLKGQAVFTVPTRALANDKLAEWRNRGWEVGIATGDISEGLDRKVIVATLETQRARLLSGDGPRILVIDEYQMIADPVRGIHYEQAIALAPASTQLLLLSGSVANPQDIVAWLKRIGRKAELITHLQRAVPLEEVDLQNLPDRAGTIRGWWPRVIANALKHDLGPILLFAPRRQASEQLALQFAAALPPCAPIHLTHEQQQIAGTALTKLLRARVAFHHSGLSFAQRNLVVEPLAKKGQLRVVVATMGLAAGINFSMRSVAIAGTTYRAGPYEKNVTPSELLQMYGRAGRRGLDETGYALVTPQPPRLADATPLVLRRSNQLDWPTLIAVMHHSALRGKLPFVAATHLNERLFSLQKIPLGCEHSQQTGPMPCGLSVDHERARFLRRGTLEIWGSKNSWEAKPRSTEKTHLSETWVFVQENSPSQSSNPTGSWKRAESLGDFMKAYGMGGAFRRLKGPHKRLGRELFLGRRKDGFLALAPFLKTALGKPKLDFETLTKELLERLPAITGGGHPEELRTHNDQLFVSLSYGNVLLDIVRDSHNRALISPPTRRILPKPCEDCPQRHWCETTPISSTATQSWRELGLIAPDGTPTRRGVIFSYFQHGEGLAVAAALEDDSYPITDLIFDLANLRGGPRFSDEDSLSLGRLATTCQQTYKNGNYEGYLRFGVPSHYASGASDAIRDVVIQGRSKQQLLNDRLRMGDIERAFLEWKSLLRHIAHAPTYDWSRWTDLRQAAAQRIKIET